MIALYGLGQQSQILPDENSDENMDEEDPFDVSGDEESMGGSCGNDDPSYTSGEILDTIESNEDRMAIPSPEIPQREEATEKLEKPNMENLAGYGSDDKPKLAERANASKRQSRHSIPRVERKKGPRRGGGSIFQVESASSGGSIGN